MRAISARLHPALPVPRRMLRLRSDTALADRFADGDEDAFAVLYERHRATVLAVSMGVLGSRHDAEDAVQESFAALANALGAEPPRDLRAWLIRVARNAAIDVGRRRRSAEYTDNHALECVAPPQVDSAELKVVLDGIRTLPESQRTALLMRELAGHTYREIADHLETQEDSVRGLIARARIGLRDHRAATELSCEEARDAIAVDPHHRPSDRAVRRHVRGCSGCQAYQRMLQEDAKTLRGLVPMSGGGLAAGGALVGSLGAKGAFLGGALTQAGAACAVSACAVGGMALIAPQPPLLSSTHSRVDRGAAPAKRGHATNGSTRHVRSGSSGPASTLTVGVTPAGVGSAPAQLRLRGAVTGAGGYVASPSASTTSQAQVRYDRPASTTRTRAANAPANTPVPQTHAAPQQPPRTPEPTAAPSPQEEPNGPDQSHVNGVRMGQDAAPSMESSTPSGSAPAAPNANQSGSH